MPSLEHTAADDSPVTFAVDNGVARVRLARPETGNGITPQTIAALDATFERCATETGVRAVLLTADGPTFTVGADLRQFTPDGLADVVAEGVPIFQRAIGRLAALQVPVVVAVHGAIAGGGLGLAWCADFLLASPEAKFATGFTRIGITGDGGSSWFLPRLIGLRRAQEMMLGGRVVSAAEALEWGLITRIVPLEDLLAEAEALAYRLASGPTFALGTIRRLLRESSVSTLDEQLAAETEAVLAAVRGPDGVEGVMSFAERRPPKFQGR